MDQFSAHLDRGWDLAQRGDTRGAHESAVRALELDPESAEAHNLLGYVAALEGDGEEAIEGYRQAIALDDTYLEAMLNAAEVYIHPLEDFDKAIEMCDQALEVAEVDDEVIDALLLKFDAHLAKGDLDGAKSVVERFPKGPFANPGHTFSVGRALYEIGKPDEAFPFVREAAERDPDHPDAQYYLGLLLDDRGDSRGATRCLLRARELDLSGGMPPWMPSGDQFIAVAERAVASLSPVLRQYIEQADFFVTEVPGVEMVADGVDPRALVLLDGIGGDDEEPDSPPAPPVLHVFLYAMNLARVAGGPDEIEAEIAHALEREVSATFLESASEASGEAPN
jgi:tetratricopeptide (TPR) repeat protein